MMCSVLCALLSDSSDSTLSHAEDSKRYDARFYSFFCMVLAISMYVRRWTKIAITYQQQPNRKPFSYYLLVIILVL